MGVGEEVVSSRYPYQAQEWEGAYDQLGGRGGGGRGKEGGEGREGEGEGGGGKRMTLMTWYMHMQPQL